MSLAAACLLALVIGSPAYGDVGVILNESLDTSVARITGSGHSAVYFSRICSESPIKLRLCRSGEQGSVISNYTTLGEDQPYEWNVVPLSLYLYGVDDFRDRPMFGSDKVKDALEERYREKYLSDYCSSESCRTSNKAEWREMVGATLSRSIYIFVLATTVDQDREFIAQFNALPNENHFNGITHNCADFTQRVINSFFRHSTGADYINDFGMTSPKAVARSFARYGHRHPESALRVYHFGQLPGTIKRSSPPRTGTEQLYRSKKLLVPMLIFAGHVLPFVAASYVLTGRFNPQHELEQYPAVEGTTVEHRGNLGKPENDQVHAAQLEAVRSEQRDQILGTGEEWKSFRKEFDVLVDEAVRQEIVPGRASLAHFFKHLDEQGRPWADVDGSLWIELPEGSARSKLGLSANNIFASDSDARRAYELALARTESILKSPKHSRETMVDFKKDWALLQQARTRSLVSGQTAAAVIDVVVSSRNAK